MTTITGKTDAGQAQLYKVAVSEPADPSADTVEMVIDPSLTHCFLGIQMFDSAGAPIAAATAGTFAIDVKTINTQQFEAPSSPSIDATAPDTISFAGNIVAVRVVPTAVAGNDITTWRVVVTCNRN